MQPRLTALYANNALPYSYSGIKMHPENMTHILSEIQNRIHKVSNNIFTTVLINQYRNGNDSNGWHADNEKELGKNPIIASVSFGSDRFFHLKHREHKELRFKILLKSGSLFFMEGETQTHWLHQIAKTSQPVGTRINLTFRRIIKNSTSITSNNTLNKRRINIITKQIAVISKAINFIIYN